MRAIVVMFLVAGLGCRASAPEPPEPIDDRPWCEQAGYDWAIPPEPEPEHIAAIPAVALLGFASIDKDMIRRVIREHSDATRACYQQALTHDPNLFGRLVVRFTIAPEGHVSDIEVAEDLLDDPCVGRCVIAVARERWRFPPRPRGGGEVTITYPLLFEPRY